MKTILSLFILVLSYSSFGQSEHPSTTYKFTKKNGDYYIGTIESQDDIEIQIKTKNDEKVTLIKYGLKETKELQAEDFDENGKYIIEDKFATRYFISTSGLPMKKGEAYVQWNLYGPDVQIGLGHDIGVGFIATWGGLPVLGTVKKSWKIQENNHFAVGAIVGTNPWNFNLFSAALPFASFTMGTKKSNLSLSYGYGAVLFDNKSSQSALASVAAMTKITPKLSLVFDSFLLPGGEGSETSGIVIPGIRWNQAEGKSFQIGLLAVINEGEWQPYAIPMLQWYRSIHN